MLQLFALCSNPAHRVQRFVLSAEIQADLEGFFKPLENKFRENEEIVFDAKYKPDPGEVLVIDGFDDIDGVANAILHPHSVREMQPTEEEFAGIKALFTGYIDEGGNAVVLIQNFDRRRVISTNGWSLLHSEHTYKRVEGIGLTLDSKIAAILEGSKLSFNNFYAVRQIFDMSDYFKEATDADISTFVTLGVLKAPSLDAMIEMADTHVRKKVALVQQSKILETVPLLEIKAAALEFQINIELEGGEGEQKLVLPTTKAELKKLLRFLDEDYYTSPLSKRAFLSNSKRLA